MTADEARALEETLGELIRRFRAEEITPLTRKSKHWSMRWRPSGALPHWKPA